MSDSRKTAAFAGVAVVLVVLAYLSQPRVSRDPAIFNDQGQAFFPELTDPSVPKALEVVEFNEELGTQSPFRVQYKDNRWTIPSHHDYPADAEDRLKKTAGAIIGLKKDVVVSDKKEDFAALGVVDPFEPKSANSGWGTRVKLFDKDDNTISDLIFGKEVPEKQGFRYARVPGTDRTYAVQTKNLDLSIKFADWIDKSLIGTSSFDLSKITIKDYSVDPRAGTIDDKGTTTLVKDDKTSNWQVEGLTENEETNQDKAREVASGIADLKIVGVRVKPPGLKPDLRMQEGVEQAIQMQQRGFYLTKNGDVVSNDGEAISETKDGLVYTLRFGGLILGTGDEVTAGSDDEKAVKPEEKAEEEKGAEEKVDPDKPKEEKKDAKLQENRFLLLSVAFDESKFPPIPDLPGEEGAEEKKEEKPAEDKAESTAAQAEEKVAADTSPAEEKRPEETKPAEGAGTGAATAEKSEPTPESAEPAPTAAKAEGAAPAEKAEGDAKAEESAKEAERKAKEEERKQKEAELKQKRDERERKIKEGQEKAKELSDRYANWYYVVSNDAVKKIRLSRAELVKEKKTEGTEPTDGAKPDEPVVPPPPETTQSDAAPTAPADKPAGDGAESKPAEAAASETPAAENKDADTPPADPKDTEDVAPEKSGAEPK